MCDDFRTFRPDRMHAVELLDDTFEPVPKRDLETWPVKMRAQFP
ncbi:MAG: putative DNA-binding transcriptional regulator YafY [Planctomycetota bacterium]